MEPGLDRGDITGIVLAGGRGSRMGGLDKGLQAYRGVPLALHALQRLAPQVGSLILNANRHTEAYAALAATLGAAVRPDALPEHPGPLAGFLAGLAACNTRYLVTVPCDVPAFPLDLVQRLAQALKASDDATPVQLALPVTLEHGERQPHPVFCLMDARVAGSLQRFLQSGQRQAGRWLSQQGGAEVLFEEASAFANANTLAELAALEAGEAWKTRDARSSP